jgi:dihydrofolate synthase / folylpolyglutamate synthase
MKINNFAEANEYLAQFYGSAPTVYKLDTMRVLMEVLGNPQEKFKAIHVAGTSGKTSTAYYAAALLTAAGYKTGLTVSPHVDEINERAQINMLPTPEGVFCDAFSKFALIIDKSDINPSWFEAMVAFAYWYFAREQVDYAVVEVGLGGLLDGTNVITRPDKVCVITDIGLDHTHILGNTLPEIAAQKAGIIHPGNRVVVNQQTKEVMDVIASYTEKQRADLKIVPDSDELAGELPLFQQRNYKLALMAVELMLKKPLDEKPKLKAQQTYIPGRMEIVHYKGKTIILDGAHNAQKLSALRDALHVKYPNTPMSCLIAFAEGDTRRLEDALVVLQSIVDYCVATSFVTAKDYIKRSVDPEAISQQANFPLTVEPDSKKAFAMLMSRSEPLILVTGSFYLLNHIRPLMLKG